MATADERDALAEQLEAAQQAVVDSATEVQSLYFSCSGQLPIVCCSKQTTCVVKDASSCSLAVAVHALILPRPGCVFGSSCDVEVVFGDLQDACKPAGESMGDAEELKQPARELDLERILSETQVFIKHKQTVLDRYPENVRSMATAESSVVSLALPRVTGDMYRNQVKTSKASSDHLDL